MGEDLDVTKGVAHNQESRAHAVRVPPPGFTHGDPPSGEARRWEGAFEFSQPAGSELHLRDFTVRSVEASEVKVEKGAILRARGGTVTVEQGAIGAAAGRTVNLQQGAAVLIAAGKVSVERGLTQWLVGGLVEAKQVYAITLIAARVEGQVKCLFDLKGAFAFGAGAALMTGLLRLLLLRKR
jgi:hypothetical protein